MHLSFLVSGNAISILNSVVSFSTKLTLHYSEILQ